MTAQFAIASLAFQLISQRPTVLQSASLTMKSFSTASASLSKLWVLFCTLVRRLGVLMFDISIRSVGQDKLEIVAMFVDLREKWPGPPINAILIHPLDETFVHIEDCVDLGEKYDAHPPPHDNERTAPHRAARA